MVNTTSRLGPLRCLVRLALDRKADVHQFRRAQRNHPARLRPTGKLAGATPSNRPMPLQIVKPSGLRRRLCRRSSLSDGQIHETDGDCFTGSRSGGRPQRARSPLPATWLKLAHDPLYVDQVIACAVPERIEQEIGFPIGERVSRRAQLAAGGTLLAARLALERMASPATRRAAATTRGGAQGAGFCTLNDVAIASLCAASRRARRRTSSSSISTCIRGTAPRQASGAEKLKRLHSHAGERNYPVAQDRIRASTSRLPTAPATRPIWTRSGEMLPVLSGQRRWDLVFYNAGVDPHREDRLGRLALTRRRSAASANGR